MNATFFNLLYDICNGRLFAGSYILLKGGSVPQKIISYHRGSRGMYVLLCNAYTQFHVVELPPDSPRFYRLTTHEYFTHFLRTHASCKTIDMYDSHLIDL